MNKNIKFDQRLARLITEYADKWHRGNFTAAVNDLCHRQLLNNVKKGDQNERK